MNVLSCVCVCVREKGQILCVVPPLYCGALGQVRREIEAPVPIDANRGEVIVEVT